MSLLLLVSGLYRMMLMSVLFGGGKMTLDLFESGTVGLLS